AARFHEANYDLARAAELYQRAGELEKAAALYEKNLQFLPAAELFFKCKEFLRAAEAWEKAGEYLNAGKLYLMMSRWDRAVAALQKVEMMSGGFVESSKLLGQVYERSGQPKLALLQYAAVVRSRPLDATNVELFYRL